MKNFDANERYIAKHGHGCGKVMLYPASVKALRSLTTEQISALCELLILGDVEEAPIDEDTIGIWAKPFLDDIYVDSTDPVTTAIEEQTAQTVAALVYVSGHLAADIPFLCDKEEGNMN